MIVFYSKPTKSPLRITRKEVIRLVQVIVDFSAIPISKNQSVAVNFVNNKTISGLNKSYVGHTGITDVISFNYLDQVLDENDTVAELFVCTDKALLEANKRKTTSFSRELVLYILHGFLHIAGFDDLNEKDKTKMRKAERRYMNKLRNMFNFDNIFSYK